METLSERLSKLEARLQNLSSIPFEPNAGSVAPPVRAENAPPTVKTDNPPKEPAPPKAERAPKAAEPEGATQYKAALEAISKEQPQIFGMLKDAAFRGLDGDNALLELPRARAFYRQILEKEDKKALIDQALSAAYVRPMAVRFMQGGETPRAQDRRTLEQAYDVFGREKVSVLDE
jgi:hypothetical protein